MTEHPIPTYQTTTFKKEDGGAIVYIALASLGALVILLGAVYFMFFNTGEQNVNNLADNTEQVVEDNNENQDNVEVVTPTPTTTQTTTTPTPTPTQEEQEAEDETEQTEEDNQEVDTSYIFGYTESSEYKISDDETSIVKVADGKVVYKAPTGYTIKSFAVSGSNIFVVFKTPEAYTYDFRKVQMGSNNLGGLFYTYYSAYDMVSFVVGPVNYRTKPTYVIFASKIKKQFLVLKVEDFKEAGKKIVDAPDYASFVEAYKLPDQDAISITYKTSAGEEKTVVVNFGS